MKLSGGVRVVTVKPREGEVNAIGLKEGRLKQVNISNAET